LNFPFEMNHFFEQDLSNLSNGLECSLGFLWNTWR
jgi:hypothetical protein